jgi:hypothetical protein
LIVLCYTEPIDSLLPGSSKFSEEKKKKYVK